MPGVGPKIEARVREALATGPCRSAAGCCSTGRARSWAAIADALGGEPAGDPRRWRDSCEQLAVVCAAADPAPVLERFAALPQIVAVIEPGMRGLTIEGVPIELVVAPPERFGTELVRATGSSAYVASLEPLPDAPTEAGVFAALGLPWVPPELREAPFAGVPDALLEVQDIRGDLHCHTTWSDGRFSVEEMGRAARDRGYDYIAICDHTPAVGAVQGLTADDVRRQGEEIAAANERLAPFRVLRGIECDILPDGRLDLPDDVLAELDWVQASVHGGQRMPREALTRRVEEALRHPAVRCLSHPTGRLIGRRPENALDLDRVFAVALEHDVALEVNGLPPRLDLSGEHVREALRAGVRIVCSTDAHSTRGLENMPFAVHTARRGGATAGGRPQHPPARRAPPKSRLTATPSPPPGSRRGRRAAARLAAGEVEHGGGDVLGPALARGRAERGQEGGDRGGKSRGGQALGVRVVVEGDDADRAVAELGGQRREALRVDRLRTGDVVGDVLVAVGGQDRRRGRRAVLA